MNKTNRSIISVTMQPGLHEKLVEHCKTIDMPVSVFCRNLIVNALKDSK